MAKFNNIDIRGTKKVPSAFGNVFISSDAVGSAKTVTFPDGYLNGLVPEPNLAFKVVFANGHNAANALSYLSLNGIMVVSAKDNGALSPLPVHAMTEGGSTVYKVLQPNTVLELYYTADYDGNSTPAFVVIGNPVVLSSADYTIYANGLKAEPPIDLVTNGDLRSVTSNAVFDEIKKWNTLGPVETIPVSYNTIQYGYTAPYDGVLYLSMVTGINDIIYINNIQITAGITKDILQLITINVNKGDVVRTGQAVSSFLFYACARFYRQRNYSSVRDEF